MKHKILHAFLLFVLIVVMAPPGSGSAQASQTVRLGLLSAIGTLDPLLASTSAEMFLVEQLFVGLTGIGNDGSIQPELAYTWETSDDGLTWTFYLRQGVQWVDSSGTAHGDVTARAVVFAIDRARSLSQAPVGIAPFFFLSFITSVTELDAYTVTFTLAEPNDSLPLYLALPSLRPLSSENLKFNGDKWAQPGLLWSSGPYLLTNWSGQKVELDANPLWADAKSIQVRKARVEYIENPGDALRRYQGGDLDLMELNFDLRQVALQDPALAGELYELSDSSIDFTRAAPTAAFARTAFSYLVKPYVQPTLSRYWGLGGLHEWQLQFNDPAVSIPDTTRVLNDETLNSLQAISEDQSQLIFRSVTPQLSVIQVNDILVGRSTLGLPNNAAPFGFLRRVVQTSTDASGQFIIDTVQAALDEAIERGNQTFSIPLEFSDVYEEEILTTSSLPAKDRIVAVKYVSPLRDFRVSIDHAVYDADGDTSTKNDQVKAVGWVDFQPGMLFNLSLGIENYQLQSLSFTNTVQEVGHVELSSNVDIVGFEKTVPIKRFTFLPQTIFIGWVPLVITPQLTIYVGASGAVSVGVSAGIDQRATITTGVNYTNGIWTPIGQITDDEISSLETKLSQSAEAGAFVGPELSIKLYDIAGPYGRIKSYLDLKADRAQSPWWTLVGGVNAELGMKVEVFSHVVASYHEDYPIVQKKTLAQAEPEVEPAVTQPPPTDNPPTLQPPIPTPTPGTSWWPPAHWPWWLWLVAVILLVIFIFSIL